MRVLSVKQPWAGAIFLHGKNVENRSWATQYRGPLLIHASAGDDTGGLAQSIERGHDDAWLRAHILGVVDLVDCVCDAKGRWAHAGAWHWILKNPRPLARMLPAKGKLRLWTLDDAMMRIVKRCL